LTQSTTKEAYTGGDKSAGGVLGPDNVQVPVGATGNGDYESSTDTRTNAVGLVTETRKSAPGNVRRLSVSVLLDRNTAGAVDMTEVEQLVTAAAGLDTERGDTLAVTALPFDQSQAEQAEQALADVAKAETRDQWISMAKTGGLVLAALVLVFLAWRASRRTRRQGLTQAEVLHLEQMQAALEQSRALALAGGGGSDRPAAIETAPPGELERPARDARQREIAVLVEQQPEDVAQLLRGWLADRRS
jgi:flagellar M-ring protein FliF